MRAEVEFEDGTLGAWEGYLELLVEEVLEAEPHPFPGLPCTIATFVITAL